jgi:hypothetical protein
VRRSAGSHNDRSFILVLTTIGYRVWFCITKIGMEAWVSDPPIGDVAVLIKTPVGREYGYLSCSLRF